MKCQVKRKPVRNFPLLLVCSGILLTISLCLKADWVLAFDRQGSLQVESGRLTGQLNQVPLRMVLRQLHEQLGLNYVAPDAELEKVISVTLQKEQYPMALSKILARWDYAFTLDAAGNIATLHMMAKATPEVPVADGVGSGGVESHEQNSRHSTGQGEATMD